MLRNCYSAVNSSLHGLLQRNFILSAPLIVAIYFDANLRREADGWVKKRLRDDEDWIWMKLYGLSDLTAAEFDKTVETYGFEAVEASGSVEDVFGDLKDRISRLLE